MITNKLIVEIKSKINDNQKQGITGGILQGVLLDMVESLSEAYPQTYTEEQKAQARANIDALSDYDGEITKEKLSADVQAILNNVANKQNITDESLATIAKTIVGAINEVYNGGLKDASIATSKIEDGAITEPKLDTDLVNVITSAVQPAELASALASYVAKADILDTTGSATDKVMSQHGVTEAINGFTNKVTELDDKIGVINASIADILYSLSFDDLDTIGYYNTLGEFVSNVNMVCKKIDIPAGTKKIITHSAIRDQIYETIVFFDADGNCVDFVYNNSEFYEYPVKENCSSVAFSVYKKFQNFSAIFSAEPLIGIRKTEDPELNRYFKELYLANVPSDDIYIYIFTTNGQTVITKNDFSPAARLATGIYDANTGIVTFTENNNSGITGYAVIDKDVPLPSSNYTTKQGKIIKTEVSIERNPFIATKVNKAELDAAIATKVDNSVFDAEISTKVNKDEFDVYETNFAEGVLKEFTLTSQVYNIDITSIINKTTSPCIGLDINPYSDSTCPILLVYNGSTIVTQAFVKENSTNVGDGWTYVQRELTLPAEWTSVKLQLRCVNLTEIHFRNLRISNSSSNNIDAGKLVAPYANKLTGDITSAIYGQSYGKKLVCLGDSITYQHQWQPHLVTMNGVIWDANDSYPGINHPLALGGAHVLPMYKNETEWTSGSSAGEKKGTSIYYMADYVKDCNPDIIIVFGGTNDITYLDHIGTINDEPYIGEEVPYANIDQVTFYGAYKGMLQKLTTQNPNAKIYAMTIMYPWYNVPSEGIGYFAETKALYNKAIRECAALYSVEVIDLCYDSGINLFNAGAYYKADSSAESWVGASARVHPNELGGEMMAKLISRHLK